jgi:Tol biopolymer transport system component
MAPGVRAGLGLPSRSGGAIPLVVGGSTPDDYDIWIMDPYGTNPRPFLPTSASERNPAVSPSGRRIAYASNQTGESEIWVLAGNLYVNAPGRPLDVRPDGQAVLVVGATSTENLLVETNQVQQIGGGVG